MTKRSIGQEYIQIISTYSLNIVAAKHIKQLTDLKGEIEKQ